MSGNELVDNVIRKRGRGRPKKEIRIIKEKLRATTSARGRGRPPKKSFSRNSFGVARVRAFSEANSPEEMDLDTVKQEEQEMISDPTISSSTIPSQGPAPPILTPQPIIPVPALITPEPIVPEFEWDEIGIFGSKMLSELFIPRCHMIHYKTVSLRQPGTPPTTGDRLYYMCKHWEVTRCQIAMYAERLLNVDKLICFKSGVHTPTCNQISERESSVQKTSPANYVQLPTINGTPTTESAVSDENASENVGAHDMTIDFENSTYNLEHAAGTSATKTGERKEEGDRESSEKMEEIIVFGQDPIKLPQPEYFTLDVKKRNQLRELARQLTLKCQGIGEEFFFWNARKGMNEFALVIAEQPDGKSVLIIERKPGTKAEWVRWAKLDWPQFFWAIRGRCTQFFFATQRAIREKLASEGHCEYPPERRPLLQFPEDDKSEDSPNSESSSSFTLLDFYKNELLAELADELLLDFTQFNAGFYFALNETTDNAEGKKVKFIDRRGAIQVQVFWEESGKLEREEFWHKLDHPLFVHAVRGYCNSTFYGNPIDRVNVASGSEK